MREKKIAVLGIIVVALVIALFAMHLLYYSPIVDRLNSQVNTQQIQLDSKDAQISSLNSQIDNLQSQIDSKDVHITNLNSEIDNLQSQIDFNSAQISNLNSQIDNLQSQLSDATSLIAQLQGPTGILPTYMELDWEGQDLNHGDYYLHLSLKNTETLPITQIYVTLNSVLITMSFTYLNTTVNEASPLPSYQTAIGIQDVTPPVTHPGTYPLVIQAITNNGTIYTYQTTITSNV
jgi:chaperonin cofactor prefoldin